MAKNKISDMCKDMLSGFDTYARKNDWQMREAREAYEAGYIQSALYVVSRDPLRLVEELQKEIQK